MNGGRFSVNGTGGAYADAANYIQAATFNLLYDGSLLVPDPNAQYGLTAQEMIFDAVAVPEPTTLVAGALMLLPFGASTLRILRRNRVA